MRELRARFRRVSVALIQLIVRDDVFGLEQGLFQVNAARGEWGFSTDEQKAKRFQSWLENQIKTDVLEETPDGKPWSAKYVQKAYEKGAVRAFIDTRGPAKAKEALPFFEGTKQQHLRRMMSDLKVLAKVRTLATRSFSEIEGLSSKAKQDLNRILANGFLQKKTKKQIASDMVKRVDGLTKARALTIARTEIVNAHAEAQLDSFEALGVEEVSSYAEWRTAGDPCPVCAPLEGVVMTVSEARGLIPRHPNCRCSWRPTEKAPKNRMRTARRAIKASVREEGGETTWEGVGSV